MTWWWLAVPVVPLVAVGGYLAWLAMMVLRERPPSIH